jgi:hypothetical protein
MVGMKCNWRFTLQDLFSTLAVIAVALALTRLLLSLASPTEPIWIICILFLITAAAVSAWTDAIHGLFSRSADVRGQGFGLAFLATCVLWLFFTMLLPA